jgi:hypothetical protein
VSVRRPARPEAPREQSPPRAPGNGSNGPTLTIERAHA